MIKRPLLSLVVLVYPLCSMATDPSCPLPSRSPCGVEEVISCARENYNTRTTSAQIMTNEDFYNKQLFTLSNQDGFCKSYPTQPPGVIDANLTGTYFNQFCPYQQGTYFSYTNFITAANAVKYGTSTPAFGGSGGFACSTTGATVAINTAQSVQEVVNFFASEAQETTSALYDHTTDGLYFRYENAALKNNAGRECTDLFCQTAYYPTDNPANWVGVESTVVADQAAETFTPYLWLLSNQSPEASAYYLQYNLAPSPMTVLTPTPSISLTTTTPNQLGNVSSVLVSPTLTSVLNINNQKVIYPGMYVGMGSLQLTGSSMYFYYGWYKNNIENNVYLDKFSTFVGDPTVTVSGSPPTSPGVFLRDGVVAFEGAFWYWMYRSIGRDFSGTGLMYPTLHQLAVNASKPACHCIGGVTLMVNGGCNDFSTRAKYASYFAGVNVLNLDPTHVQCIQTVTVSGRTTTINGAQCTLKDKNTLDQATQDLLDYCKEPVV